MKLPQKLINNLQGIQGFDEAAFVQTHAVEEQVTSVRFNPFKLPFVHSYTLPEQQVPWCTHGYYLNKRPSFILDPLWHGGLYYVQEASSMFLWHVLQFVFGDHRKPLRVLDLCAAPGGKSTLLASFFDTGLIVANETIKSRASVLVENITRWGAANVIVTNNDPAHFRSLPGYFDVIVVDAPCSGSGLLRRTPEAVTEWSEDNVQLCSRRQQRILSDILPALKEGGVLVYSTCSYSADEDETITEWLQEYHGLQNIPVKFSSEWGIVATCTSNTEGYRFYPDKIKGEGFFISVFRKTTGDTFYVAQDTTPQLPGQEKHIIEDWLEEKKNFFYIKQKENILAIPELWRNDFVLLQKQLYLRKAGIAVGAVKGNDLVPNHELALSKFVNNKVSRVALSNEESLVYLRKNELMLSCTKGWHLVCCNGIHLGWIKVLPNRINNYYPVEWRILKS